MSVHGVGSIEICHNGLGLECDTVSPMPRRIPWFRNFICVRQPADKDCVISIEYNSELLNHMSKNWEVVARRKYIEMTCNRSNSALPRLKVNPIFWHEIEQPWIILYPIEPIDITKSTGCRTHTKCRKCNRPTWNPSYLYPKNAITSPLEVVTKIWVERTL